MQRFGKQKRFFGQLELYSVGKNPTGVRESIHAHVTLHAAPIQIVYSHFISDLRCFGAFFFVFFVSFAVVIVNGVLNFRIYDSGGAARGSARGAAAGDGQGLARPGTCAHVGRRLP